LIKAKLVKNQDTLENELHCYSELKEKKEQGMRSQALQRYETELKKLLLGLSKKRGTKKYTKVLERFGRLKEKYKQISYAYDVKIIADEAKGNAIDMQWTYIEDKQKSPGVYCLRSNCADLDEQTFWDIYIMLTELEAAFRCLKSELGLRPIYHQITKRVDSHIFISVLAYHVLHMIRYKLKCYGINESWETIRNELRTHSRITSAMKCKNGGKLHIRKTSLPNPRQLEIYRALNISPSPSKTEKSIF
jgi:transposase